MQCAMQMQQSWKRTRNARVLCWAVLLWLAFFALVAQAAPGEPDPAARLSGSELVSALREGGLVIYFRHADTGAPYPEQEPIDLSRCDAQRNLNDNGRAQAKELGTQFRRLGIPIADVLSSEFCRCWQTAQLAFGHYRTVATLTGVPRDPSSAQRRSDSAAALQKLLAAVPSRGKNTILVSHGYNLFDLEQFLLGTQGEAAIYRPDGRGGYRLVARLVPEDWAKLPSPQP